MKNQKAKSKSKPTLSMSEPEEKASDPSLGVWAPLSISAVSTHDEVTNGHPKTKISYYIVSYPRVLLSKV